MMLTLVEKILFVLVVIGSLYLTYISFGKMVKVVRRGQGELFLDNLGKRLLEGLGALVTTWPVFSARTVSSPT